MRTRNRAHALTLSVASMAAVLSLTLATPNAGAAPTEPDPTTPTTSAQPAPEATQPAPTASTSGAPSSIPSAPTTSEPSTSAPTTSTTPSTDAPQSTTTAPKPQARAAVAAGCQTYPPTSYQVCGRIRDKYNQLNGPNGYLLFPKSNELTNPGNTGKRSEFLGGNIYWSTATDAHPVAHDFLTKWGQYGYEGGFMRYPTTDEIPLGGLDGRRQEFQGAWMYYSIPTGTHNVQGAILDKYKALGAQGSYLGYPTSDEQVAPDGKGRFNTFQNGAIYWSPSTGAWDVATDMMWVWGRDGFEAGKWGYPTGARTQDASFAKQPFQGGLLSLLSLTTDAKEKKEDCLFNQEWPHKSSHDPTTVDANLYIKCQTDKVSLKASAKLYYWPACDSGPLICGPFKLPPVPFEYQVPEQTSGVPIPGIRELVTGSDKLGKFRPPYVKCQNGDYMVATDFTVTKFDGSQIKAHHDTPRKTVDNCPDSESPGPF